jgi:hypothetical protein
LNTVIAGQRAVIHSTEPAYKSCTFFEGKLIYRISVFFSGKVTMTLVNIPIPMQNKLYITKQQLHKHNVDRQVATDVLNILETILKQNYFQYEGNFYKPQTGIAMGSPLSGIIAEICTQHLEHQLLKHALENKDIITIRDMWTKSSLFTNKIGQHRSR